LETPISPRKDHLQWDPIGFSVAENSHRPTRRDTLWTLTLFDTYYIHHSIASSACTHSSLFPNIFRTARHVFTNPIRTYTHQDIEHIMHILRFQYSQSYAHPSLLEIFP
jgi:hypothetical protein